MTHLQVVTGPVDLVKHRRTTRVELLLDDQSDGFDQQLLQRGGQWYNGSYQTMVFFNSFITIGNHNFIK